MSNNMNLYIMHPLPVGASQNAQADDVPFPMPTNPPPNAPTTAGPAAPPAVPPAAPIAAPAPAPVPGPRPVFITSAALAKLVASRGIDLGAQVAAAHHRTINNVDPPSLDELVSRVLDTPANLIPRYVEFFQRSPNAVALRLLAPRAGTSYPFEESETTFTDPNGKTIVGRKCGAPGCEYRNKDHGRHMAEMHVRDIGTALCCPVDGCDRIYYEAGRDSEMKEHFKMHQRRNERAQREGREIVGISPYPLEFE